MAEVKVYSTPTCPFCKKAKQFLKENSIPFEDLDVAENAEARSEMIKKSGQTGVPVLDIDGEVIVGFDVEKVRKALDI